MAAPQTLKDTLLRLLDETYETDSVRIDRCVVVAPEFVYYGEDAPPEALPTEKIYKVIVDAADRENIRIRIRPVGAPVVWPF